MKKAVFIDRDGVVNSDEGHYYIYKIEDFVLNPDLPSALALLKEAGFMLVLITNQGGVAKGIYTVDDVNAIHQKMQGILQAYNANFDAIYCCPHHNEVSNCECRKPKPGMLLQAAEEYDIDLSESFLIGDSLRDIQAGEAAGVKQSYRVEKNTSILGICESIVKQ
ncbi:D-glycero-alpha-D-manno-heptose-1,7-bisphosphate 7-phosphatase [Saccharicrinis aurantiacus]|uniref:D-glycero-alpha-D-manno-heptose-1,7-bisphosphate 7-phosphatase n=1 Tax=Saccharicrinis aurantiacus TaxID=1849719 RepID=UPI00094F8A14|nr:HAD family hydrolase [Saccharicrinis aurantiacus]